MSPLNCRNTNARQIWLLVMSTVITGISGFVGFHLSKRLLARGEQVIGIQCETNLQSNAKARVDELKHSANANHLTLIEADLSELTPVNDIMSAHQPVTVIHLSQYQNNVATAQKSVSHTMNLLEACRLNQVQHCILNSSHAVYFPHQHSAMSVHELTEHPRNLQGATARANELFAHSMSLEHQLPCTIVRLFNTYGEGADDDSLVQMLWNKVQAENEIDITPYLGHEFDFTYIDDVCNCLIRLLEHPAKPDPDWELDEDHLNSSDAPWRIYNIGTGNGTDILGLIELLEVILGKKAKLTQSDKVAATQSNYKQIADTTELLQETAYQPRTSLKEGLQRIKQARF